MCLLFVLDCKIRYLYLYLYLKPQYLYSKLLECMYLYLYLYLRPRYLYLYLYLKYCVLATSLLRRHADAIQTRYRKNYINSYQMRK